MKHSSRTAVAALAGRRVDAPSRSTPRFPAGEEGYVANKLLRRFDKEQVGQLVCSAACGADILALEAARQMGVPARIVLPFSRTLFRTVSVTDRPGDWGKRFDVLISEAESQGRLIELDFHADDPNAFSATNHRIVREAAAAGYTRCLAFVVWEGRSRGADDITEDFLKSALACGFEKRTVLTMRRQN